MSSLPAPFLEIKCPVFNDPWEAERSLYKAANSKELVFGYDDTTVVITHAPCNDGYGAAMAAKYRLGDRAQYFGAAPGDKFDWSEILELTNQNIVFADIAPPINVATKLMESNKIIILDHHKTQQQDMQNIPEINKVFDMNHSGAYLAWRFFHPEKPVPRLITLIEKRDLWIKDEPDVDLLFEYLYIQDGEYDRYIELINDDSKLTWACEQGRALVAKRDYEVSRVANRAALHISKVNGNTELIAYVNTDQYPSDVGNYLVKRFPADYAVVWKYNDRWNTVGESLRSMPNGTDVSVIAKSFFGGGHKMASGVGFDGLKYLHDPNGIPVSPTLVKVAWNTLYDMRNKTISNVLEAFSEAAATNNCKILIAKFEEYLKYNRNGASFDIFYRNIIAYMALDLYNLVNSTSANDKNNTSWLNHMGTNDLIDWVEAFARLNPYTAKTMNHVNEVNQHIRDMPYVGDLRSLILLRLENKALSSAMAALLNIGTEVITLTHFTDKLNRREWKKVDTTMRESGLTSLFADDLTADNQAGTAALQQIVRFRWNATLVINTMNRVEFIEKFGAL